MLKVGGIQIHDFIRECREPFAVATLRPWIDVNSVGTLVLKELKARFGAVEAGRLSKPGEFYDFTRYRPTIYIDEEGIRDISVPNTTIHFARREDRNDLLLLRLLEPHAHAEVYVSSVVKLLKALKAKRYILLGSMYDMVPHTRPLLVSGYGMGKQAVDEVKKAGVLPIVYRGPSTFVNLITKKAAEAGIDVIILIVSLPQYVVVEEDYLGKVRLMEILNMLYDIPIDKQDLERAVEQHNTISERVANSSEVKMILPQLENVYDMRIRASKTEEGPHLPPEIEAMLWKTMGKDVGKA